MKHDDYPMLSVEEARARILARFRPLEPERIPILEALDRVLAEDVTAEMDIPPLPNTAMDGYAVRVADTADASPEHPARLKVVADLAAAAGCSEGQLERRMKKVFGLTATQYVLRVRVDRAAGLLVDTDRPIADIAVECGFSDQANLTRLFGRLIGETPARFRATRNA